MTEMTVQQADKSQAAAIAPLIMEAMNTDCCLHFAGPHGTLSQFEAMMTRLVASDHSQYSYRNTLVAVAPDGSVAGICVAYDGALLHRLRQAFVQEMMQTFGRDFSRMDDETQAGELYLDSLAVSAACRGNGVGSMLLEAMAQRARREGLPAMGLLVDKGNPRAERLYQRAGFRYVDDNLWGGHLMRHLQREIPTNT